MLTAEIQRPKGIEALVRDYKPKDVDEERHIRVEGETEFVELTRKYEQDLEKAIHVDHTDTFLKETRYMNTILTPEQINTFLQTTIRYENYHLYDYRTGDFISRLMQNSYEAGNNNFFLDTTNLKKIYHLGYYLNGTEDNPVQVTIQGDTGHYCGFFSKRSTFHLTGDTGDHSGQYSQNCEFKTPNQRTLQQMLQYVPEGNRIIYIRPDGTEEVIRDDIIIHPDGSDQTRRYKSWYNKILTKLGIRD